MSVMLIAVCDIFDGRASPCVLHSKDRWFRLLSNRPMSVDWCMIDGSKSSDPVHAETDSGLVAHTAATAVENHGGRCMSLGYGQWCLTGEESLGVDLEA
jgi:hypothetical protein